SLHRDLHLAFNQRARVLDKFFVGQKSIFTNPIPWDEMLDISNFCQRLHLRTPAHRPISLLSDDLDHQTALPCHSGLHGGFTPGEGVSRTRQAGAMFPPTLSVPQQHISRLCIKFSLDDLLQLPRSSRQHRMTESVQPRLVSTDLLP